MPRLNLSDANVVQLNDWLYGGATDPLGIIRWLAETPGLTPEVIYQGEGERDFYLLLLSKNKSNIVRSDITPKMADALSWVSGSLDQWEALGIPIEDNQQAMRPLWNWIKNI